MKILSFVKENDFLGKGMGFKINSIPNHQTLYGGCLSIIYYCLFTYFAFTFGFSMFINRHPSGYSQIKPGASDSIHKVNFTTLPFLYGIRIEDDIGNTLNMDGMLFPTFVHRHKHKNNTLTLTKLEMKVLF